MAKTEDRRVRKTKAALKEVLIEALQIKDLSRITVMELCKNADINRSTFYLHFDNVYSLWQSIESEICGNMENILNNFDAVLILKQPLPMLLEITEYLENESLLNRKLFKCRESVMLLDRIKMCFIDYFISNCSGILTPSNRSDLKLYSNFVISGAVTLFYQWFLGEIDLTMKELAFRIEKLITGGVEEFLFN